MGAETKRGDLMRFYLSYHGIPGIHDSKADAIFIYLIIINKLRRKLANVTTM